jgi:hypothetical protein
MDHGKTRKALILYGPFLVAAGGLVVNAVLKTSASDNPLIVYASFSVPLFVMWFSLIRASDKLDDHGKKIEALIASIPQSAMHISTAPLKDMEQLLRAARQRIDLMYLSELPKGDTATNEYWDRTTASYLSGKVQAPIRRIATISNRRKLEFLLKNNAKYLAAGRALSGVEYHLVLFPSPELRPPQFDIIDKSVLLFSPYGGNTIVLTEPIMVEQYAKRFGELFSTLADKHTLLCTTGRTPSGSKRVCSYSPGEIQNIIHVIKGLPELAEPGILDELKPLLEPYLSGKYSSWENFTAACGVPSWSAAE